MKNRILGTLFALALLAVACGKKDKFTTYDCSGVAPTYNGEIKIILDGSCAIAGCHNNSFKANGIDLSTYEEARKEAEKDRFRGAIQHAPGFSKMPQGADQLDENIVRLLSCWVQNDMPE